ncbi:MAG: DNA (cytosine-5-)-methyltransferase [Dinoroseobacter sp.]|jgi:DNA (cytosine-5)-methyltransferase 1|uniref:DNA cytosine methyltransferase n=1 Tax=Alterinioella nitratireducens TaxID=2735915 RepID=UPI000C8A838E|nr:DNA cytosine methyltransferase [Alterinioella nitratireducens]MAN14785.1 DNA (cytosine-5-)-methyltransferase [Dinoroseobacter sp.]NPD21162.1 DNA cytosine methyltransferase [Alterinioella nitratireducens]|tara:strand:- start:512 stop:1483 length:972 start_codon:yes stop_codon:yes gene_type:complete
MRQLESIEFCAGAGGQALGLEQAGFSHVLLVDNDLDCCATLRANRPGWNVHCSDMTEVSNLGIKGIDLFAAGLPCPPFSIAGKQLGAKDERNLFPAALRLIAETQPKFVLIENVRGFLAKSFAQYRAELRAALAQLGYEVDWCLLDAKNFSVSQSRSRVAIVAARKPYWKHYSFPKSTGKSPQNVGELLSDLMAANGWEGIDTWQSGANAIAPTIVGGSKKHGGPDLGPTRAREAWRKLGVNGGSIAEDAPMPGFDGPPRLTNRMVARVQGFPDSWMFTGKKTAAYRQIGNAFPPPVARSLGVSIRQAIVAAEAFDEAPLAAE